MTQNRNELAALGRYLVRLSGTSLLLAVPVYLAALLARAPLGAAIASVGVMVTMTGIILGAGVALRAVALRVDRTVDGFVRVSSTATPTRTAPASSSRSSRCAACVRVVETGQDAPTSSHGDAFPCWSDRARTGIRAALVDRFDGTRRFSSVSVEFVAGGRQTVKHLISTGWRHIAFVGGTVDMCQVSCRVARARAAVGNAMDAVDLEVLTTPRWPWREIAAGCRVLARPRREWPDALFDANGLVTLGLLQSLILVDGRMLVP